MRRLLIWAGVSVAAAVVIVGVVLFYAGEAIFGPDLGTVDRYNEETMASLPVYPGATLVETYKRTAGDIRSLTNVYATNSEFEAVRAFYADTLPPLGWEQGPLHFAETAENVAVSFSGDRGLVLLIYGLAPDAPAEVTPVASPPTGTVTFFRIKVSQ